ncbi:MAG: MATE family efflux transporter [Bacteroidales bacterium]|nr:MATE family efflux transporter [Bacteroidales bacterium]
MRGGNDLTKGNEAKVIVKFAIPMMVGNIFQQLYNVVDAAVVGKFVGKEALSATGVSFPILFLLSSITIGFAIGGTIIIAQFYGAKKIDQVKKTAETLQIIMFIASFIITFLGIFLSRSIFNLLNFPEENIDLAVSYFNILMVGNIAIFGYNAIAAILRGLGDSKTPVYFLIISTIANIIGDILLVVVFDMGIQGAAIATVLAYVIAYGIAIVYLNKKHKIININFKISFDKLIFKKILKIGVPSSGHMFVVSFGMILSFSIINLFGTDVIAGFTAAGRINSFAIMPAMFFSNALSAFVGQNFGANKLDRIKNGLKATMFMISGISIFFTAVSLLFPAVLMKMFTNVDEVVQVGVNYFTIVAPFYLIFGLMFSFNAVFRGVGNTITPMYITLVALWVVRFPAMILLSMDYSFFPLKLTPVNSSGLWWGEPLAWTTGLLLAASYYLSKRWIKKAQKVSEDSEIY